MKKHAFVLGAALLVTSSVVGLVGGCGSDDVAPALPTQDAGGQIPDGSTNPPDNNPGPRDGSTNNPLPDGSTNNPLPDGSDNNPGGGSAGKVTCGNAECSSATEACCKPSDGGTAACQPKDDDCQGGTKTACDEPGDCSNGELCCRAILGATSCKANSCGGASVRLCKTADDCGDAGTCKEYGCPGGSKVMACSAPIGCN